jgi:signal transduction histidine kinase/DNA-binding response OmpR family regulator
MSYLKQKILVFWITPNVPSDPTLVSLLASSLQISIQVSPYPPKSNQAYFDLIVWASPDPQDICHLRTREAKIPILAIVDPGVDRESLFHLGVNDCLVTPYSVTEITRKIQMLFNEKYILDQGINPIRTHELEIENWSIAYQRQKAIIDVINRLRQEISERIQQHISIYLLNPFLVNQINKDLIEQGLLDPDDFSRLCRHFWTQLHQFPTVNTIQYADDRGYYLGLVRQESGIFTCEIKSELTGSDKFAYLVDDSGSWTNFQVGYRYDYDPRQREWYQAASQRRQATWSQPYQFSTNTALQMGVMAVLPLFDQTQRVKGVLGTDITPWQISDYLMTLKIGQSGFSFVMTLQGRLIASSRIRRPFTLQQGEIYLDLIDQCGDSDLEKAGQYLQTYFGSFEQIQSAEQLEYWDGAQRQFLQVLPFTDPYGISWLIAVVVPEIDFVKDISVTSKSQIQSAFAALDKANQELEVRVQRRTEELRKAESELKALFSAMTELIFVVDASGRILKAVRTHAAITTGLSTRLEGELYLHHLFSVEEVEKFLKTIQKSLINQEILHIDYYLKSENAWYTATLSPMNHQEILWVAKNVTSFYQIQESLAQAKAAAESANRTKSMFLARMSHELRTPLNAVLGVSQLLYLDQNLTEQQKENLKMMQQSGNHLLNLINDVLEMSKIESGKYSVTLKTVNLVDLINDLYQMLKISAEEKGIILVVKSDPFLPELIETDEMKLRQILLNLLSNAIKFTAQGQVLLSVSSEPEDSSLKLCFVVEDTGIGIPESDLESIFDPFIQLHAYRYQGTGIGLAITREFIQLLGGRIWVESSLGQGSKFLFYIPVKPVFQSQPTTKIDIVQPTLLCYPAKILLAEDNPVNQLVTLTMLTKLGYQADTATNGNKVLAAMAQKSYDLILMDLEMPEMGGLETANRIRQNPKWQKQPIIIALTAHVLSSEQHICFDAGMQDCISKPITLNTLKITLERWLQGLINTESDLGHSV